MARGKHYWHLGSHLSIFWSSSSTSLDILDIFSFKSHEWSSNSVDILDIFSFKSHEWSSNSIAHEDMPHYRKPRRRIHHKKEQHHILVLLCGVVTAWGRHFLTSSSLMTRKHQGQLDACRRLPWWIGAKHYRVRGAAPRASPAKRVFQPHKLSMFSGLW